MDLLFVLLPMAGCVLVMLVCMRMMMAMRGRSRGSATRPEADAGLENERETLDEQPAAPTSQPPGRDA